MRCQILINQLQTSYDCQILIAATSAANLSSCQILNQLQISLYLYFPFYYNTNFKINQAAKAVKFSRANLKRFKL